MKKNRLFYSLLGLIFLVVILVLVKETSWPVQAIDYTQQTHIPGTEKTLTIDGSSFAKYVVAVYKYGAGFAGVVAMFMLVMAGWQWLMAAGSAEKINRAKTTINNVLIGLALLFGGYLLLSQISENLVNLRTFNLPAPVNAIPAVDEYCQNKMDTAGKDCNVPISISNSEKELGGTYMCYGQKCDDGKKCFDVNSQSDCRIGLLASSKQKCECVPTTCDHINKCKDYKIFEMCQNNKCYDKDTKSRLVCFVHDGECKDFSEKICHYNDSDCDTGLDGQDWCCDRSRGGQAYCKLRSSGGCSTEIPEIPR